MTNAAVPADPIGVPLADTLDEARLRQVFPDAPADVSVPSAVSSLFKARMRRLGGSRRALLLAAWGGLLLGAALLAIAGQPALAAALGFVVLVATGGVLAWQHNRAGHDFFKAYARGRGLSLASDARVDADVPLLRKGDKRRWPRVFEGVIAGQRASIAHFTYVDVSTDSEGNRTETDHDYTTVHFTLPPEVAARFAGVSLGPRSLNLGALQDKLSHDRGVELESAEFGRRYQLRVVDSQNDIALYELFSTPFIMTLATEMTVYWEQRGDDLVVWRKGHAGDASAIDRLCLEAWHVLHRYQQEHR